MDDMPTDDQRMLSIRKSAQASVEKAISILRDAVFDLELDSDVEKKTKELIFQYFESKPYSRVDPRTIVAVLLRYSACACGEWHSRRQIASALKVDLAWVQRKRHDILAHCGIELYQPSGR